MKWRLLLVLLASTGCAHNQGAPAADAGAICYTTCTPSLTDTGVRWEGDPEDPQMWDGLGEQEGVIPQLVRKLFACERSRQECAGFLNDLKRQKVLKAKEQ